MPIVKQESAKPTPPPKRRKPEHEALLEKVTVRYLPSQKDTLKKLQIRHRISKESDLTRQLLDAALNIADKQGLGKLLSLSEEVTKRHEQLPPPEQFLLPLYAQVIPTPSQRLLEECPAYGTVRALRKEYPVHAIAFKVEDEDMSQADLHIGDIVALDPKAVPRKGDIVAVQRGKTTVLRRLKSDTGRMQFATHSDEYQETFTLRSGEDMRGVVLGKLDPKLEA